MRLRRGEKDDMNKGVWTGNLTRDPEVKVMTNGESRAMITLAVQRDYISQSGVREADFITFIAYRKTAETVAKYLTKGRKILVVAHVRTGSYEKDGKKIYTTEFVIDRFEFLSPAPQAQNDGAPPPEEPPMGEGFQQVDDDDLPF